MLSPVCYVSVSAIFVVVCYRTCGIRVNSLQSADKKLCVGSTPAGSAHLFYLDDR